ncbi:MAG: hypothetical protein LBU64_10840 [Planctomycetota bacterium]|nr:hypothetical protein [Planctomycetota bacterium]
MNARLPSAPAPGAGQAAKRIGKGLAPASGKAGSAPWPGGLVLALAGFLAVLPAGGGEGDAYARALAHGEAINARLDDLLRELDGRSRGNGEGRFPPPGGVRVAVGGELRFNYAGVKADYAGPNPSGDPASGAGPGNSRIADLKVSAAKLNLDVGAGRRWRAFLEINLQGFNGFSPIERLENANAPGVPPPGVYRRVTAANHIGQAYVELLKDGHSGPGFRAGLIRPDFGLRGGRDSFGQSFLDAPNLEASGLMLPFNQTGGLLLPHASRFRDPVAAVLVNYEWRDIIRLEGGVFREPRRERKGRFRPDDSPWPRSWQIGAGVMPLEGWELTAVFRNRHSESRGLLDWVDSPFRPDFRENLVSGAVDPGWNGNGQWSDTGTGPAFGSRKNEQALAIGLALDIPGWDLGVSLEYAHGWNQGFNRHIGSDDLNLGLSRRLTPFLTLLGQAEWLRIRDRGWLTGAGGAWSRDGRRHRLYRFLLGIEYEPIRRLILEAGWQYEYRGVVTKGGGAGGVREKLVNTANLFYLGSRLSF